MYPYLSIIQKSDRETKITGSNIDSAKNAMMLVFFFYCCSVVSFISSLFARKVLLGVPEQ